MNWTWIRNPLVMLVAGLLGLPALAAEPTATDAAALFGARPDAIGVRLSPDGTHVAYIAPSGDRGSALMVLPMIEGSKPTMALMANAAPDHLVGCDWVANDRLVCREHWKTTLPSVKRGGNPVLIPHWRLVAVNLDGTNEKTLDKPDPNGNLSVGINGGNIIDLLPEEDGAVLVARNYNRGIGVDRTGLAVDRLDTRTGNFTTVLPSIPYAIKFLTDGYGTVRVMEQLDLGFTHRNESSVIAFSYRDPREDKWHKLSTYDRRTFDGFLPLAVDGKQNVAYGLKELNGRRALYTRRLDESRTDELVYANDEVDVAGVYTIGRHHRVVGADYLTDYLQTQYTDPDIRRLSESLRRAVRASTDLRIVDSSVDETKLLLFSVADQNAGLYYIFDRNNHHLDRVMFARERLDGVALATTQPIKYPARDGTSIPGYLTLPPGETSAKGLPAIVMPHGGPNARDVWGFDWMAQFFAHQGYAVLQPNFRGSAGFGGSWFENNGFKSWQIAIGDVLDAGRWLVGQGIADPNKLGILGWSYGGYAALQSVVVDQDIFKAAVAIAPVTDLADYLESSRGSLVYEMRREFIGTGPHVHEGSPAEHADKIKVPVLLFHGQMDLNVNYAQSRRMDQALNDAGVKHKLVTFVGLDHQLEDSTKRTAMLRECDEFFRSAFEH